MQESQPLQSNRPAERVPRRHAAAWIGAACFGAAAGVVFWTVGAAALTLVLMGLGILSAAGSHRAGGASFQFDTIWRYLFAWGWPYAALFGAAGGCAFVYVANLMVDWMRRIHQVAAAARVDPALRRQIRVDHVLPKQLLLPNFPNAVISLAFLLDLLFSFLHLLGVFSLFAIDDLLRQNQPAATSLLDSPIMSSYAYLGLTGGLIGVWADLRLLQTKTWALGVGIAAACLCIASLAVQAAATFPGWSQQQEPFSLFSLSLVALPVLRGVWFGCFVWALVRFKNWKAGQREVVGRRPDAVD